MKDATKLMEAASNLYSTVGPVGAFLIVAFILIVLIYRHFQRKQFYNFYYEVLNQKEAQIQRVADENRE